ncbi:proteoglycan 4-like [Galendromus occidentalis]|uniref:Proteoglycan 4-like n=1 Tax=Galendromus occidentalis TaxID=34638 RepID=A0AAJ7SFM0_9ACAR|nr:proteoglycan 4-like [Galendromus occidentalis]
MTYIAGSKTLLVSTICVLFHLVHSQSVYPAAQFRDPDYRERWNHDYRRGFTRRRGPFGIRPQSWSLEQTTMDPLSRFHYPGIRGSRNRRPIAVEADSHNGDSQADYGEHNSTEAQFVPIVQRRKLIRPRKPPIIPLQREEHMTPFRYSTNDGNYRQPTQVQHRQAEGTTTDGPRESTSEETSEAKSYVGLPGYWKPIRVPPYGYNYPRWYHVQRTNGAPEPDEKEEEQSIEEPPTTTDPPVTEGLTSYEDVTEGTTTEQAQKLLGLGYRPAPHPFPHHFPTHIPTHVTNHPPNVYPPPPPPPPPPHLPRPAAYPSTPAHPYREPPSTYPPSSPPSTAMDYHTWLRRQHELMVQSADEDEEVSTPPSPTTPLQPVETTETDCGLPDSLESPCFFSVIKLMGSAIERLPAIWKSAKLQEYLDNRHNRSLATTPAVVNTARPNIVQPTSAPTPRSSTAPISPSPESESANTLSTSETSTFFTNVNPSRQPQQFESSPFNTESTFIGPVRKRPPIVTQANRDDRRQHHSHHHQHHRQEQDRSEEQQRSASEVELTIRTHQENSGQQDEHERLKAGEVAGMVIGLVSLIATIVGCVTFLILKKPLATCEDPPFPTPEPTITSVQRTFPGGAMYSGEDELVDRAEESPPPPPGPYPPGHRKNLMQPIPEWSYSPASSIRLSFEEVNQAVQQQNQAPSRASMNVAADQRERPGGFI